MSIIRSHLLTSAAINLIHSEEESMQDFIKKSDWLVRIVNEIFDNNQAKLCEFDESHRMRITSTIRKSLKTLIKKLNTYIQNGEGRPWTFNPGAKERIVGYLQGFLDGKSVTRFSNKVNELLQRLETYDTKNNEIDWYKIDKIIDAFKRIQKSSKISS